MSNKDKMEIILKHIQTMYPNKMVLNATQTAKVIGISGRTFHRFVENEEWHRLPKFKREIIAREGKKSSKYQFSIFDIAEFLTNE